MADGLDPNPAAVQESTPNLDDPSLYINRELSWLAFNERVLMQASLSAHPLLERVKFVAIAANNLDEFFMVRIATLARRQRAGLESVTPDGLGPAQELPLVLVGYRRDDGREPTPMIDPISV